MSKEISRRIFLRTAGISAIGGLISACAPQIVTQVVTGDLCGHGQRDPDGRKHHHRRGYTGPSHRSDQRPGCNLTADALPLDKQVWLMALPAVGTQISGATGHEMESLYSKAYFHGLGSEPLTRLDKEGEVVGVSCESWKQSDDGMAWDFFLRKELVFSDDTPITAKDWVWTFQRSFGKGYDFGWMFADILNSSEVLAGKKPPEELGMEAVDDYTLRVKSPTRTPYVPALMTWAYLAPKQAYEQFGDNWSVEPDHFITNGPWLLTEFERGVKWTFKLNPKYKGVARLYMTELRGPSITGHPECLHEWRNPQLYLE